MKTTFVGNPIRRFRQTKILIVGCGDVGLRVAKLLPGHIRVLATTSSLSRVPLLRSQGITPLAANLDHVVDLQRLAGLATYVLQLAPPPPTGAQDPRTKQLLLALKKRKHPLALVYASTTGVYGDCQGDWVSETRAPKPQTDRACRRVDAEARVRHFGNDSQVRTSILRIPGIYSSDRVGADPLDRVRRAEPVLVQEDDVYINRIHANDLARSCIAALFRGKSQRVYNVGEGTDILMGDYYDALADAANLPRPPRITKKQASLMLSPMRLSFLSESRRITCVRFKRELKIDCRFRLL